MFRLRIFTRLFSEDGSRRRVPGKVKKKNDSSDPPLNYPQLLGIPLSKRPLFPGFYKSMYINEPLAVKAIQSLWAKKQPYVGIFLARTSKDLVTHMDDIERVGVFAQITNVYQAGPDNSGLTVVVYPHRRIRCLGLVQPFVSDAVAQSTKDSAALAVAESRPSAGIGSTEGAPEGLDVPETKESRGFDVPQDSTQNTPNSTDTESLEKEQILSTALQNHTKKRQDKIFNPEIEQQNYHIASMGIPLCQVENIHEEPYSPENRVIKATANEVITVLKEISQLNPLLRDQIITISVQTGNLLLEPAKLADFAAAVSSGEPDELQSVLESLVVEERLNKALVVLKRELANAKLQQEISKEVDKKISRKNQEYFLMEQLKGIKKELGLESDGKEKLIENFKEKASKLHMSEQVRAVFDDVCRITQEIKKLQHLEPAASEFNVTRNYLDWLTQIPWGQRSQENFEVQHAKTILDEDHYGLKDVKDRILEFIAVGKLRGTVEGKIVTLVGPPGVGKTSIGKSIARALGREFFRFSVGGLTDVAEIKGHRRTYVGAMPGKVVQALKKVKTENPLIMIDESTLSDIVDKLGRGHQGDPASALLELLDPEQNSSFLDHYLDVPVDLSKVLFVCTANTLETIPAPLLDRMEVIKLSGYVAEEKVAIATKYLSPASRSAAGLDEYKVMLKEDAVLKLIRQYCRESGVRNLKKHIDKVYRKAAFQVVEKNISKKTGEIIVDENNLVEFVGSPLFTTDRMYQTTPPGVVMGLAWTQMGGSSLYIESVLDAPLSNKSKAHLHHTGQMGDVMKESTTIAYTYAKSLFASKFPENDWFGKASIHMHVPEGATPKDGPSAGCTMTTSLLSLALGRPVIPDVAMTGEITLTGKILKIGGVKEKSIAAKRSGVKTVIFPKANKSDWDELPAYIKEGLNPHFVEWYQEIYDIVFPK